MNGNAAVLGNTDIEESLTHQLQPDASIESKFREDLRRHRDWSMGDQPEGSFGLGREGFSNQVEVVAEAIEIAEVGLLQKLLGKELFSSLGVVVGDHEEACCKGVPEGPAMDLIHVLLGGILDVVGRKQCSDVFSTETLKLHCRDRGGGTEACGGLRAEKDNRQLGRCCPEGPEEHRESVISIQAAVAAQQGFDAGDGKNLVCQTFSLQSCDDSLHQVFGRESVAILRCQQFLVARDFAEPGSKGVETDAGTQNDFFKQFKRVRLANGLFDQPMLSKPGGSEQQRRSGGLYGLEQCRFFFLSTEKDGLRCTGA